MTNPSIASCTRRPTLWSAVPRKTLIPLAPTRSFVTFGFIASTCLVNEKLPLKVMELAMVSAVTVPWMD